MLREARDRGQLDPYRPTSSAEDQRCLLIDHIGGCERISKTPLATAYVILIRRFLVVFLLTLPFALLRRVEWMTPVIELLVAYPILALDHIADDLQQPFSTKSINHLPLNDITTTIETNLMALVDGPVVIDPTPAVAGRRPTIRGLRPDAPGPAARSPTSMSRDATLDRILDGGIVAVVRSESPDQLVEVVRALAEGGVTAAEITFTVPGALEVIRKVRDALGDSIVLGAGSVLDPETARAALLAGAEYIVGPGLNPEVIRLCRRYGKVVMPGALTPTEVIAAWEAGADVVKIFPADLGGPGYLKSLRGPLPQVRLMPTGGVDLSTAGAFLAAGACCLGVGSSLVDPRAVASGDYARLTDLASQFAGLVRKFRSASGRTEP